MISRYIIRSSLPYSNTSKNKYKKYESIALVNLYNLQEKLAWFLLSYFWKKRKTEKIWGKKTHNFASRPLQGVRDNFIQKFETANQKRMKRWSGSSIFSFQHVTADEIYDCPQDTIICQIFIFAPFSRAHC